MRKKQALEWVEHVLLFSLLVYFYCGGLRSAPYNPDESQWIATSSDFEAYVSGDFSSPVWNESYWTNTQPPLPRYLIGLGRRMGGLGVADLNNPWDWQKNYQTNIAAGNMPSQALLWWSRLPMEILGAAAIFTGFILLKRFTGRLAGYIWVGLCLLSAYLPETLGRAMGEAPLLACIAGSLLIAYQLLQVSDNRALKKPDKLYIYFLLLGISIGLAESSKLNGLSAIAAAFMLVLIIGARMKQTRTMKIRFGLISILIVSISSQLTFIILNPYLWKDPLITTKTMFYNRVFEMRGQMNSYTDARIQGFDQHIKVGTMRIFQSYSSVHLDGVLWINLILFLIGLTFLIVKTVQYLKYLHPNPASAAILVVGAATSLPSLFTPLDWDRYYLLPVYFSTLAITVGIWGVGLYGYRLIRKKDNHQQMS
jgi:4-amino-4-deoxy-L-arabinose transferase-like glycosyltransferase